MLKLERASREGMISVIVRDKENLFTQPFTLAFCIAIAIHLSLILLFHVAPFKIGMNDTIFPPTRVEADALTKESAIAEIEPAIQTIRGLPSPPPSRPQTLHEPKFLTVRPMEYRKAESTTATAFNKIENVIYQPEFTPLVAKHQKPLEILISGILAEQKLLSNGINDKAIPSSNELRITYSVMVEGRTGKIFWFESKQHQQHFSAIDKFAESLLNDMKFAANPEMIAMSGEIELHFNSGTK